MHFGGNCTSRAQSVQRLRVVEDGMQPGAEAQPPCEEQPGEGGGGGPLVSEETKEGSKPEKLNPFSVENRPSITKRGPQG